MTCCASATIAERHHDRSRDRHCQSPARPKNGRRSRAERAPEEFGIKSSGVVAEQLGGAKLQNERQLRAVVNVRDLEDASVAP